IWENPHGLGYMLRRPALVGDELVIGADRGVIVVNKITGATKWSVVVGTQTEDGLGATPVVENGIMYYRTKNDAKLYARNMSDGSLVWSVSTEATGTFSSPVLTSDGFIYLSYNSGVKAFDKTDGSTVWTSPETGWVENTVSIGHGYLLFTSDRTGTGNMKIYRINKESYISNNGLTINRDQRLITGITSGVVKSTNFNCDDNQLAITDAGNITIDYGSYPEGVSIPSKMILNPISNNKVAVCRSSGTDSFTYSFGFDLMTDILRDGIEMLRSSWSKLGDFISITDSFSSHVYEAVIIPTSTPTVTPTVTTTTTPTVTAIITTTTTTTSELPRAGGIASTLGLIVFGTVSLVSALFLKFL
ncbi:MAG: PQQ-binding-like beta-propeller repeat protein, partial [Candidatus Shapirobacteria bacterium]